MECQVRPKGAAHAGGCNRLNMLTFQHEFGVRIDTLCIDDRSFFF